jgi:hypothetical protein
MIFAESAAVSLLLLLLVRAGVRKPRLSAFPSRNERDFADHRQPEHRQFPV